jgi:MFS family permease
METAHNALSTLKRYTLRLGIPDVRGYRLLFVASFVDWMGNGAFEPVLFVYIAHTTSLSPAQIGLALTIGTLLAQPVGPLAGTWVDAAGPRKVLVAGNCVAAAGYALFLLAGSLPMVVVAVLVAMVSDRLYFAAWPSYVGLHGSAGDLDRWYALTGAVRSGSGALGGLLATGALLVLGEAGLRGLLVADIASSVVTAALMSRVPGDPARRRPRAAPGARTGDPRGWALVLRDRRLRAIAMAFTALSFGWLLPTVAVPAALVTVARLPAWLPSAVFAVNAIGVFALQTAVTSALGGVRRTRSIAAGAASFAGAVLLLAAAAAIGGAGGAAVALAGAVLVTGGELLIAPAIGALVASMAPATEIGRYNAAFQVTWSVSTTLGPLLIGTLAQLGGPWLWLTLAALMSAGGAGILASERLLGPAADART